MSWLEQQQDRRQIAVGSAQVVHLSMPPETEQQRALVEIRWSALAGAQSSHTTSRLWLRRPADIRSKGGVSSLGCAACGGPAVDTDDARCGYCGEAMPLDQARWQLKKMGHDTVDLPPLFWADLLSRAEIWTRAVSIILLVLGAGFVGLLARYYLTHRSLKGASR